MSNGKKPTPQLPQKGFVAPEVPKAIQQEAMDKLIHPIVEKASKLGVPLSSVEVFLDLATDYAARKEAHTFQERVEKRMGRPLTEPEKLVIVDIEHPIIQKEIDKYVIKPAQQKANQMTGNIAPSVVNPLTEGVINANIQNMLNRAGDTLEKKTGKKLSNDVKDDTYFFQFKHEY